MITANQIAARLNFTKTADEMPEAAPQESMDAPTLPDAPQAPPGLEEPATQTQPGPASETPQVPPQAAPAPAPMPEEPKFSPQVEKLRQALLATVGEEAEETSNPRPPASNGPTAFPANQRAFV